MHLNTRTESKELLILRLLFLRMALSADEKQHYLNLEKGYEGEVKFDLLTVNLDNDKFFILNDLFLESGNTIFQIDSLIITQEFLIPCEVKNYQGNYYYQGDNFYHYSTKKPITNPLHQLNRCETLLSQLLKNNGFHFPTKGRVIFINPEFLLYQAPLEKPITFHPQLNNYLRDLNAKPSKLNGSHRKIVDLLLKERITEFPYTKLPPYAYDRLRKGLTCASCHSFSIVVGNKKIDCNDCGHHETTSSAVIRSVKELKILFPEMKITTNIVLDWCQSIRTKRAFGKILRKSFTTMGHGRWTYYE